MSNNTGGPAFPYGTGYAGMTLRDYFAAKAMEQAMSKLADWKYAQVTIADYAYKQADAMLKAREA